MNIQKTLSAIISVIIEEAERNDAFKVRLERALNVNISPKPSKEVTGSAKPRSGRRTPAVLDPVEVVRKGDDVLRARLGVLNLEQLRDIVAQYGMDPGKLVMRWKDTDRVIGRIVELAQARASKGDAFRRD